MGSAVEVFFPTKPRECMAEEEFLKEQKRNMRRGILFGVKTYIQEIERNILKEVEDKNKIIKNLESKIENIKGDSPKVSKEKEILKIYLDLTRLKELEEKDEAIKD